jgi:hypothetical protein
MKTFRIDRVAAILTLAALTTSCGVGSSSATVDSRSVRADSARSVQIDLAMQPGNLSVQGGATHLLDARFNYSPAAWRPTISYAVSNRRGKLVVSQQRIGSVTRGRNTWDVRLSNQMPVDLDVTSGPGNATLWLRALTLKSVSLTAGAGNITIDAGSPALRILRLSAGPGNLTVNLDAAWNHSVNATINGAVGNTTLRLPARVGVRVTLQGEASVQALDLSRQNGAYVNAAYGHSPVTVQVSLSVGLGNVVLQT